MSYTIHALELRKDITAPEKGTNAASDGTTEIRAYRSLVQAGNLEPKPEDHLAPGFPEDCAGVIPAGHYLFTQVPNPGRVDERETAYRSAAEAVWLEALWRGVGLKNDRVLVRTLSEDGKTVFQVFREIEGEVRA